MKKENIWNKVEQPEIEKVGGPMEGENVTHPAFGQIGASRVSGHVNLYGSDFVHNNFIAIRVSHGELRRGLSNDWPHVTDEITEVWLSEAQWATFVSSLNSGTGVQCTIRHVNREPMPLLPPPTPRTDQFKKEAAETMDRAHRDLEEIAELIGASNLSGKAKKELLSKLQSASRSIGGSVDFVLKQFGEHMENTVEKAKIEVEAYINDRVQKAGLKALGGDDKPFGYLED
jgi:hypothetical protein